MDLLSDLMALLRIPSVTGDEEAIADYLQTRLAGSGRAVRRDGRSVLVSPASDERPLVVLAGHTDTVPPAAGQLPRSLGERVVGRGSVDMKAGLAAMVRLLDDPAIGDGWARVGAIFYAGEEGPLSGNDLGRLLEGPAGWARDAELVILLEPTGAEVEVGCVGTINAEATFRGEPCHSARPWLGRNAVTLATGWISRISALEPVEHHRGEFLFRETATITQLRAGSARNIVPGELWANLNYRFPPGWSLEEARTRLAGLTDGVPEVRIVDEAPAGSVPLDRPLFAAFLRGAGRRARSKQGWTDVGRFSQLGVPALNFGPGDPALAHRDDEEVALESIRTCLATLASFLGGEGPFAGEKERR